MHDPDIPTSRVPDMQFCERGSRGGMGVAVASHGRDRGRDLAGGLTLTVCSVLQRHPLQADVLHPARLLECADNAASPAVERTEGRHSR